MLIIDDYQGYILPEQKDRWIAIKTFDPTEEKEILLKDRELIRVQLVLEGLINMQNALTG